MRQRISMDESRLKEIAVLMDESNQRISHRYESEYGGDVGFTPMPIWNLKNYLRRLFDSSMHFDNISSLDLGCGNGTWNLLTAAFGIPSYGIDVDDYLIGEAQRNKEIALKRGLLTSDTPLEFVVGNIYPEKHEDQYHFFRKYNHNRTKGTMPDIFGEDPYKKLGIDIKDMGIIYSFLCEDQLPFLCNFLDQESAKPAVYIIPYGITGNLRFKVRQLKNSHFLENIVHRVQ